MSKNHEHKWKEQQTIQEYDVAYYRYYSLQICLYCGEVRKIEYKTVVTKE